MKSFVADKNRKLSKLALYNIEDLSFSALNKALRKKDVKVNGKRVNIASYLLKEGDVIEVREKSKDLAIVLEALASTEREVPDYYEVDEKALKGTFLRVPKLADVPYPVQMEPNQVVELYSR